MIPLFKKCNKCNEVLPISAFYTNEKKITQINPTGTTYYCKLCHSKQQKQYYLKNRKVLRKYQHDRLMDNRKMWIGYFIERYGEKPSCQICGREITWYGHRSNVVHFDHKMGATSLIETTPNGWFSHKSFSELNKKIWDNENFGILCASCNVGFPTKNRKEWLVNACRYMGLEVK